MVYSNEHISHYADLNDWVVLNNTKSPDFSVKFDSKEIKSVKYDDSKVKVGTDGKYVLTYTITDAKDHVVKKDVLVTVGDKKVVNELSEKGVWVANGKTVAGNSSTTKPVVKPENKPNKPSKPNNLYWSSFLVTLCSEIMLYIETPLVSYSYSLNEVSHSCTS